MDPGDVTRLFEHFIIAGSKENTKEFEVNGQTLADPVAPITDICVIKPTLGETVRNF